MTQQARSPATPPPPAPAPAGARAWPGRAAPAGIVVLAATAVLLPVLAMPAVVAVLVGVAVLGGRGRVAVASLGSAFALLALGRFVLGYVAPNVVSAGSHVAERGAVDRLRQLVWAQERARELGRTDRDGDGRAEFESLEALAAGERPLVAPRTLAPLGGASEAWRGDTYLFVLRLPARGGGWTTDAARADPAAAASAFRAWAWPERRGPGGRRVFFIDQDERICESPGGRVGIEGLPPPDSAPTGNGCGPGADGTEWRAWRGKKPRPSAALPVRPGT